MLLTFLIQIEISQCGTDRASDGQLVWTVSATAEPSDNGHGKDTTAMSVADATNQSLLPTSNARHRHIRRQHVQLRTETILRCMGTDLILRLQSAAAPGLHQMVIMRTRWLDELIRDAVKGGCNQVLILAAGYDTRGFRLKLPPSVRIFEVDQPAVQALKRAKLASIEDLPSRFINFVPVDFTTQSLEAELLKSGFDPKAPTVATMEGLTQYIPKSSTEATLQVLNKLCSTKGSVLGVSYVVQDVQDALGSSWGVNGERFGMLLSRVNAVGEPWIASWEPSDFERMLRERGGFEVKEETAQMALAKKYLKPLGRMVPAESKCEVERYVTAVRMEFGLETRRAQIYAENKVMRQHEKKQFAEFKRRGGGRGGVERSESTREGRHQASGPDVEGRLQSRRQSQQSSRRLLWRRWAL